MKKNKILSIENQYGKNRLNLQVDFLKELEKDKWDVRSLGIPYNQHRADYSISFEHIPSNYRNMVKSYVQQRVIERDSITWQTAKQDVLGITNFFSFLNIAHPEWTDLTELTRGDIDSYYSYLKSNPMGGSSPSQYRGQDPTNSYICTKIASLETFLYYMQRYDWKEAPTKPVRSLIYQEDRPKLPVKKENQFSFMSDFVWDQINENISKIDSQYVPIVMLMERTGLHLVEILSLLVDCLKSGPDGNWLISERTRMKQIPISQEIADLIKNQQQFINEMFPNEMNPNKLLFLRYKGKTKFRGQPYNQQSMIRQLKTFAIQNNIKDENGNVFNFCSLSFRHRFGVKQIMNGMTIVDLQKVTGHVTPVMPVMYAKINDFTIQNHFEKITSFNGVYLHPISGHPENTTMSEQAYKNQVPLDWLKRNMNEIRLEQGYCVKSPRTHCQYLNQASEPPCIIFKCLSFYVDQTFSDYYDTEIEKMENVVNEALKQGKHRYSELVKAKMDKFVEIRTAGGWT
ncbi:tyrosine-type recombinase/integrase [Paenibacillus pini]|uniref:Mobile element protein n=1 Tax=Paenibacillus pini JCM 16418 TaxID=1236976 RepID=W7YY75_9BACL|nr:tyrosine-type recombinase/integrase [Paenibacillus pini]GAF07379.1 mobile element protein [Paenibacillus pini JCM 16418]